MSIVIIGASGHLGRLVAGAVLDRADPSEVVLVTRDPSRLADLAERGADIRAGDLDVPGSLAQALVGATKVLVISTDRAGARVAGHKGAIDAAAAVGEPDRIHLGAQPSESNPIAVAAERPKTEEHLRASGAGWTMLRTASTRRCCSQARAPRSPPAGTSATRAAVGCR